MKHDSRTQRSVFIRTVWIIPFLLSGVIACQEEHEPVNTPPAQSNNLPGTVANEPPIESDMPTVSQQEGLTPGIPGNITGEVVSIEEKTYVIKDQDEREISVEVNSMTLVDESITVGDQAEIRYSADNLPIAIRKMPKPL
ncbi:hypothetical protein PJI16_14390 [Nitrospira sp. MA-1]|nr:hypothetical protein [Nitrospira sp. MA-1]